ncbi:MAG: hypothetical protein QNL68_01380 [Akkermansiaceae bacterium]
MAGPSSPSGSAEDFHLGKSLAKALAEAGGISRLGTASGVLSTAMPKRRPTTP